MRTGVTQFAECGPLQAIAENEQIGGTVIRPIIGYHHLVGRLSLREQCSETDWQDSGFITCSDDDAKAGRRRLRMCGHLGRLGRVQKWQGLHENEQQQGRVVADVSQSDRPCECPAGAKGPQEQ